ncbi:putative multidrug ABC transporter permease YbhR [Paenibacillus solanacearum]|uniref:Multidrug ABC transporter permease YbhR n=1 Tax=Paenibacillus solanacearum TaxID=2048548 RepID=A0A916K9D5_9BACL|nr:ABC transporter permease [Paenibacillus solanacearum]CAG7647905.1 putative multidrug ABC transporter permease YbhR [Paenibacillus solanacearum]
MNAYIQLTIGQLRLFARNRQVLMWTLFFPIFFMVMLGSFLGKGNPVSVSGHLIDLDHSTASAALVQALKSNVVLDLQDAPEIAPALEDLKQGDTQLVIVIPKGYGQKVEKVHGAPAAIKVYYDETNAAASQVGLQLISPIIDGIDKRLSGYMPKISLDAEAVQALKLSYIDFLVPGIVAMMIMSNNLNGVAGQIAAWRERGVLRRLQSTTLSASTFIAAQITARLLLNGAQAVIVLLIGSVFFGTRVNGSWLLLLGFIVLGTLTFMSIGFIIAGLAKTPESAGPIAGFVSFPMMFLGGVFFPIKNMPEFLQPIVKLLPISHLTTALRQVMNAGAGLMEVGWQALLLGGWLVVAFVIACFTFKWE